MTCPGLCRRVRAALSREVVFSPGRMARGGGPERVLSASPPRVGRGRSRPLPTLLGDALIIPVPVDRPAPCRGQGGSLTPANAPQWPQEHLSRHTEGEKVSWYRSPDLRRAVGVCWRVEAQRLGPLSPARENVHTMESVTLTQKRDGKASGSQQLTVTTGDDGAGRATFTGVVTRHTRRLRAAHGRRERPHSLTATEGEGLPMPCRTA